MEDKVKANNRYHTKTVRHREKREREGLIRRGKEKRRKRRKGEEERRRRGKEKRGKKRKGEEEEEAEK